MIVRRILLALLLLILVVVAIPTAFFALNIPVDLARFKQPLANLVSEQIGMDVKIEGDMRLVPGLEPTFEMQGLEISDPERPEDGDSISLGLARIQVGILSLLVGGIRIEELTAEDIRVVVFFGKERAPPPVPAEDRDAAESTAPESSREAGESSVVFKGLEDLSLRRIDIDARNVQSGKRHRFVLDEMIGAATLFSPLTMKARGSYQGQPFRVEMTGETIEKLLLLDWSWPLAMRGEIAGLSMELAPAGTDSEESAGAKLDYKLEISGNRFDDLDSVVGVSLPPLGPYSVSGRFSVLDKQYSVSDFELHLGESNLKGSFDLDVAGEIPRIEIDLTADKTRLEDFDVGEWSPAEAEPSPESTAAKTKDDIASSEPEQRTVLAAFDPEILKSFYFRLSLATKKVESQTHQFGSGSLVIRLEDGVITLDPLKVEIPQGLVEVAVVLDPGSRPDAPALALLPMSVTAKVADTVLRLDRADDDVPATSEKSKELRYRVSVKGERLDSFDSFAGVSLPPVGPYSLTTLATARKAHFSLKDLDIRVGHSDLKGDMLLDNSGVRPRAEVRLSTEVLQLEDFIFEDWSLVDSDTQEMPEGATAGTDSSDAIDQEELHALLSRESMTLVDASFALDVGQVLLGEEELGSGKLGLNLDDGRLDIKPVRLDIPGGAMDMSLALEPGESNMFAEIGIDIDRFDYGVLARRQKPDTDMGGIVSLDVSLSSRADMPVNMLRHANGHVLFGIWPENIEADVFELWTVNLILAIIPSVDEGPQSKVNCLVAGLEFQDGSATNLSLLMDTTNMQVGGKIEANFESEEIHVYLKPRAKRPQFFSAATPIEVNGSFSDFGVSPAPGALAGTVIRMVTSIVTVPVQRVFKEDIPEDGQTACAVAYQGGIPEGR